MYTKNNYLEDCYFSNYSKGMLKKNAKIRKKYYEKGRFDLIYQYFPEYRESDYKPESKKTVKHIFQSLTNSLLIIIISSLIFMIICIITNVIKLR